MGDNNGFNQLSNAEIERLAILAEELGESIQTVGKILRHGYNSWTNKIDLENELGHVSWIIGLMDASGDIEVKSIESSTFEKMKRGTNYLHHQAGLK